MHNITFVNTAKWIIEQFRPETIRLVFEFGYLIAPSQIPSERARGGDEHTNMLIRSGYDIAIARERIKMRPEAVKILAEFHLSKILDEEWTVEVISGAIRASNREPSHEREVIQVLLSEIGQAWRLFTGCIKPMQQLLTPEAIQKQRDFDEILTLEMSLPETVDGIASDVIAKFVKHADSLYSAFCELHDSSRESLTLIYMVSGSKFRFDFKGLGEPIRALKEMYVEFWQRIRHRKAEDLRANSSAVTASLTVLHQVEMSRQNGVISEEDASRLRHTIVADTLGLFDCGALIREIPNFEEIENLKLVGEVQQKLLPAPKPRPLETAIVEDSGDPDAKSPSGTGRTKKKTPRKRTMKTSPPKEQTDD